MSRVNGLSCPWEQFPDWLPRYDFATKAAPDARRAEHRASHGESPEIHLYGAGSYQYQEPRTGGPPVPRKPRRLVFAPKRQPLFFTSFLYEEAGAVHECTRAELCAAFRKLVGLWQELLALACAVYDAWDLWPYVDAKNANRVPTTEEQLAFRRRFFARVRATARAWARTRWRLFWEAEYMGQYLAHLSDMEDAGRTPSFRPYPRATVKIGREMHPCRSMFNDRVRLKLQRGQIDDYAFRAAKKINQPSEAADVTAIRGRLMDLFVALLEAKGYCAAQMIELDCHRSPGYRYIPPPERRVTAMEIYQDLTGNPLPSTYDGPFKRWRYWDYDPVYLPPTRPACSTHHATSTACPYRSLVLTVDTARETSPPEPPPPYASLPRAECSKAVREGGAIQRSAKAPHTISKQ